MKRSTVGMFVVCAALVVGGCANDSKSSSPQIAASCVPPTVVAQVSEGSLVVTGEVFLDDCADVFVDGKAVATPQPLEDIVVSLTQGDVTADLGTISADGEGNWAMGTELATLFNANPKLKADSALVIAQSPDGHEAQANVTLALP